MHSSLVKLDVKPDIDAYQNTFWHYIQQDLHSLGIQGIGGDILGHMQQQIDLDIQTIEKMDEEIVVRLKLTIDDSVQWAETWITAVTEIDTQAVQFFEVVQEIAKEIVGLSDLPHSQDNKSDFKQLAAKLDQAERECREHFNAKVMEAYMCMQYQDIIKQSLERAAEALTRRSTFISTQTDGTIKENIEYHSKSEMGHILADYVENDSRHR